MAVICGDPTLIGIQEEDGVERNGNAGDLGSPSGAAVCGAENDAIFTHRPSRRGVQEEDIIAGIGPQPASSFVTVGLRSATPVNRVSVVDMKGVTRSVDAHVAGSTVVINVQSLPNGVYALVLQQGKQTERRMIHVFR